MPLPDEILAPIDGDNPVGANLEYEPVYEEIKTAREEEDEIPQGEWRRERKTADWAKVVKLSTDVLLNRSKDLQVAAWLTEGLTRREGYAGLQEGLVLVRRLMEEFWDGVYPVVDDGDVEFRAMPLEWLGNYIDETVKRVPLNRAGHDFFDYQSSRAIGYEEEVESDPDRLRARNEALAEGKVAPEDFDDEMKATPKPFYKELVAAIDGSQAALKELEALSDERFGEFAPSYRGLRTALDEVEHVARRLLDRKLEMDPDPPGMSDAGAPGAPDEAAGAPADGPPSTPAATGGAVGRAAAGTVSAEPTSAEDAAERVAGAARWLRRADPTDPAPYLMLRGFRWGELRRSGESADPRLLAAPPTRTRTHLKGLLLDANWEGLVDAAEEVMATEYGRGWLDLQRYVLTGLDGLGSGYERVRRAVRSALGEVLRDLPSLPELTLMDDTPTANRETRRWLQEEGIFDAFSAEAREELEAVREGRAPAPASRDVVARARERLQAGQPRKAIELLLRGAEETNTERVRFLRRSEATRIMVEEGLEAVAMPILKEMLQTIQAHDLEEWESGDTIAQPLGLLYRCLEALGDPAGEMQDLYLRVCRLDPMQAIHFTGAKDEEPSAEEMAASEAGGDGVQG